MIDKRKLELFKELFDRSKSVLVMCSEDATRDQLLAATSFYAALKSGAQKNVKLLCSKNFSKEKNDIAYLDESQTEIGHENLCVSLDYLEESIDKVSYHVSEETKKFYLTVKPKKGFPPLSKENVSFSYTGAETDMIVLVGVDELNSLGKLYVGYENLFNTASLVSINSYETEFGSIKFDNSETSSFCEYISQILIEFQIPVDPESATNLLTGISEETKGFNSHTSTADTFNVVSKLMRAGARRVISEPKSRKRGNKKGIKKNTDRNAENNDLVGSFSPGEMTDEQKREKEKFRLKKIAAKNKKR